MGLDIFVRSNKCVPIERVETKIKIRQTKLSSPEIKRTQLPLMLSWACTFKVNNSKKQLSVLICSNNAVGIMDLCSLE